MRSKNNSRTPARGGEGVRRGWEGTILEDSEAAAADDDDDAAAAAAAAAAAEACDERSHCRR